MLVLIQMLGTFLLSTTQNKRVKILSLVRLHVCPLQLLEKGITKQNADKGETVGNDWPNLLGCCGRCHSWASCLKQQDEKGNVPVAG